MLTLKLGKHRAKDFMLYFHEVPLMGYYLDVVGGMNWM
jgi:hypothetical protein